jgi:hypothetical protein
MISRREVAHLSDFLLEILDEWVDVSHALAVR